MGVVKSTITIEQAEAVVERVTNPVEGDRAVEVLHAFARTSFNGGRGSLNYPILLDGYTAYHHSWIHRDCTLDEWNAAAAVQADYRRAKVLLDEARDWVEVDRIYFADNSVEVVEQSRKDGGKRTRMVKPPSGDPC